MHFGTDIINLQKKTMRVVLDELAGEILNVQVNFYEVETC